jgi:hypothetical protein
MLTVGSGFPFFLYLSNRVFVIGPHILEMTMFVAGHSHGDLPGVTVCERLEGSS